MRFYAERSTGMGAMNDNQKSVSEIRAKIHAADNDAIKLTESERKKLSKDDLKRYDKLTAILAQLKAGKTIDSSKMRRWLKDDYASIAECWDDEKKKREDFLDIPSELKEYEERLNKAIFTEKKSEFYSRRGHKKSAQNMRSQADRKYEGARERLMEILHANPYYHTYLDRPVSFDPNSEFDVGIDSIQMPRLITSRSLDRQGSGIKGHMNSIQDIKKQVVEGVLRGIVDSVRSLDVKKPCETHTKLQQLLNIEKDNDIF